MVKLKEKWGGPLNGRLPTFGLRLEMSKRLVSFARPCPMMS
ncbi:hypothetical protein LTAR_00092 [Leptolinea tardivitalis]|nr:hypothetical protein LTAR_00092 [Leptolinea tardivitalis]